MMQHPFVSDLTSKSTDEIAESITSLGNKLSLAYRLQKADMAHQIQMVLESYKTEYAKRMDEMYKKQNVQNQIKVSGNR